MKKPKKQLQLEAQRTKGGMQNQKKELKLAYDSCGRSSSKTFMWSFVEAEGQN